MPNDRVVGEVASCVSIVGATAQLDIAHRNRGAIGAPDRHSIPPITGRELRAQLKAQQGRNCGATTHPRSEDERCASELSPDASDSDVLRRRARALALLDADPGRHIAVIAEAGDPAHVTVAIRGVAVGDVTIPGEKFDVFALLELIEQYGHG